MRTRLGIGILLLASVSSGWATLVDFSGIADGTPASGVYGEILRIEVLTGVDPVPIWGLPGKFVDGVIKDAQMEVLPPREFLEFGDRFHSELSATFLQPVIDLSLDVFAYREAGFSYYGRDSAGEFFAIGRTIYGLVDAPFPFDGHNHFDLTIPFGAYITGFSMENRDPKNDDAAFWVDNIAFKPVPEAGSSVLMLGFGLAGLVLCMRREL